MDGGVSPAEELLLLRALRLSLKSSDTLVRILEEPERVPDSESVRKIIAAILWHRKFVLTYYAVLGLFVAVVWGESIYTRRARRRQSTAKERRESSTPVVLVEDDDKNDLSTPSSSSSTLRGTVTPPMTMQKDKIDDENDIHDDAELTPLLDRRREQQVYTKLHPQRRRPRLLHRLRAFLMYQPRPVWALTAAANILPSNGTSLAVLALGLVNMFYLVFRVPLSWEFIFILADRAGLLFVVNLPVLYVLAAKTNQPLKLATGWSYEGLNIFHRRLGEWMVLFGVVHMLGMFVIWYTVFRALLGYSLWRYCSSPTVLLGLAAITSYVAIYGTSVGRFRQLYYETFLGLHILLQVAALAFLFFHYPTAKPYVGATFAVWAVDRLVWRMTLSSRRFVATLEVAPDNHTVMVHCDIPLLPRWGGVRAHMRHGWAPGQHVFLTIPSMGFKYRFQTHPFTIASAAPPDSTESNSWPLQLVIRAIDGFSLDLLRYAKHHQHCQVIMDGPHGGTEALEAAHHADRVCFVAGGSGVAVTYPLAWDVRVRRDEQAQALVSSRTTYKDGVKSSPLASAGVLPIAETARYAHFWVRQDPRHGEWITTFPRADAVTDAHTQLDKDGDGLAPQDAVSLVTRTFDTRRPGPQGGRPDMKSEIWEWVTSGPSSPASSSSSTLTSAVGSRSASPTPHPTTASRRDKICIVVSGPDGLVRDVRNVAAELVRDGWNLDVWVEKFGW